MENALDILLHQKRFDLMFKYLYAKNPTAYHRWMYVEHIRAFNGFHEMNPSDGIPKESEEDFVSSFDALISSLKKYEYSAESAPIPVGPSGEIQDGAHRLAICAALGLSVRLENCDADYLFDYRMLLRMKTPIEIMDYGALEYVKLNPNAYIVNLQPVTSTEYDDVVESILNKYGYVYYKKIVNLTFDGLVNIKKMSYGSFWDREEWIGNAKNGFAGAYTNAKLSYGVSKMRVFVFACEDFERVLKAKAEIRALYNIGNYSVHINDHHDEAVWLAETYFNANSLFAINNRPFAKDDKVFDDNVEYLKSTAQKLGVNLDDVCGAGSTPLNVLLIRHSDDMDYLSRDEHLNIEDDIISPHDSQLRYYPYSKEEIITNPANYQYYHGLKLISLDVLYRMKHNRGEMPKDRRDCRMIQKLLYKSHFDIQLFKYNMKHHRVFGPMIEYYKKNKRRVKRVLMKI